MIPNTKENQTILLNLSKSAIHADDTNLAKASTSGACNLIFPFKKNKLGAYWRLVTQVYPIFPLKKNKLGAYWWLVTQVYPIFPLKKEQTWGLLVADYPGLPNIFIKKATNLGLTGGWLPRFTQYLH